MAASFELSVVHPDGLAWTGRATYLLAPAHHGSLGILARHAPLVAALRGGSVLFDDEEAVRREVEISGGVLKVGGNRVAVLADKILAGPEEVSQAGRSNARGDDIDSGDRKPAGQAEPPSQEP